MEEKLPSSSSKPSRTPSGRRLNANSLLNFRFSPLEQQQPRRQRRTKVRAFNKFHYVKAQFRFMLSSGREHLSLSAVDKRVDWDRVELVEFPVDKMVQCPICMSEPVAPRLTKCGHVYCFHCILNYLSRSPFNYSRCPLCFESIYLADLKPLTFFLRLKHRVGDKVRFTLIRRRKDSVLCTPVDADDFGDSCSSFGFSSIRIGRDIAFNLEKDHRQLSAALSDAEASEAPFILKALRIVENLLVDSSLRSASASLDADAATISGDPCDDDDDETFLFYQSHNGERLFLDSLCYRCLLAEFKDADHLPGSFQAEIVALTPLQQNQALRSKFRFLSHLTLTTSFEVCEVRMDDLVSRENLKPFRAEFSKRVRSRKKQQKMQERVDLAAKTKRDLANVCRVTSELQLMPSVSPSANPFRLNLLDDPVPGGASGSNSSALPQPNAVPAPSTWSLIADRGLASSTVWAPLPATAAAVGPALSRPAAPATQPRWPNVAAATAPAATAATVVAPVNPRSRKGKRTLFSNVAQRRPR